MELNRVNLTYTINIKYKSPETRRLDRLDIGDWIDLSADENCALFEGKLYPISLGVAMQLPKGFEAHVIPRSSTYKKYGILLSNSMGLIDNSYRGDNDWWIFPALAVRDTFVPKGARICQFRIMEKQPLLIFNECESFDTKSRGGFGSTGN